jgi:predicted MPP superfamily phosphohydrolase
MLTFLSMVLLIYGAMHMYVLGKLWLAFHHSSGLTVALALWGIVMTLSPLILWQMTRQNWHGTAVIASWVIYLWMGFLFLFCCIALILDLGHALATLFGFKWRLNEPMTLVTTGLLAVALLGYGFVEARQVNIEEIRITTPKLASGQVTIAHISDLHLGMMRGEELLERVIASLRDIHPDIVVATGDIVDGQGDDLDGLARRFLAIQPPKGAYAIVGNHEYYAGLDNSLSFLHSAGFTVLRGESAATAGIILAGVDDPSAGAQVKEAGMAARAALASARKDTFIVLLKHQPVVDRDIPFDLQLSGHIHGGQIFPFGLMTRLVYGVRTGLTRLSDGRLLYISRGAGTWGPPIRLFAAPEITVIRIESENK